MGLLRKVGIGIGIAVGILFVIVIAVGVMTVQNIQEKEKPVLEPTISGSQETQSQPSGEKQTEREFVLGETAIVAGIAFKVTGASTSHGTTYDSPEGTFVIVDLVIENIRKETASVSSSQFILTDAEGREFESTFISSLSKNYLSYEDAQPNLPIDRSIAFDVPFNSDTEYKLLVKPPLFSLSSDKAIIKLGVGKELEKGLRV